MQNKIFRIGPTPLTTSAVNQLNPPAASGGVGVTSGQYVILRRLRAVNKTGTPATISTYIGATGGSAAGTEFPWNGKTVPANDAIDWVGAVRLDVADFLTALASAGTTITLEGEGEVGVAG